MRLIPESEAPVLAPLLLLDIDRDQLLEDIARSGGRILFVIVLAFVAIRLIEHLILPLVRVGVREQMAGQPEGEVSKRITTLTGVIYNTISVIVITIAIVTIMPEFGVNAGPLIAGLGLVGLAVGFGAQNIVRDVINGVELLIENQYGRGDFVRLRSTTGGYISGMVEDVNLRRTVLRDNDGSVHFISHGSVEVSSNFTRIFSRVYLQLAIPASADIARARVLIDEAGQSLAADPAYQRLIRQAPHASSLEKLGQETLEIRIVGETEPGEQWTVGAELRLRLKTAFDAEGIHIYDLTTP